MMTRILFLMAIASSQAQPDSQMVYPFLANFWFQPLIQNQEVALRLADYDVVVIDCNVFSQSPQSIIAIHSQRPTVKILSYVNPLETWKEQSPAAHFPMQEEIAKLMEPWFYVCDIRNQRVSQPAYPYLWIMNITSQCPDSSKRSWGQVFQSVISLPQFSRNADGWFIDNVNPCAFYLRHIERDPGLDLNGDGIPDQPSQLDLWHVEGMVEFLQQVRQSHPRAVLVGNGGRFTGEESLNGTCFEDFPTPWIRDGEEETPFDIWRYNMIRLVDADHRFQKPGLNIVNGIGNQSSYQAMRFSLASSLIAGAAFSFDRGSSSHAQLYWFDEFAVDPVTGIPDNQNIGIVHRGYLGIPKGEFYLNDDLYCRDFQHGLVICNPWPESKTIHLTSPFRLITGKQDPSVNSGEVVTQVSVRPRDGRILLRIQKDGGSQ